MRGDCELTQETVRDVGTGVPLDLTWLSTDRTGPLSLGFHFDAENSGEGKHG